MIIYPQETDDNLAEVISNSSSISYASAVAPCDNKDIPNFFTGSECFDTGYNHLLYKGSEGGKYTTHIESMIWR